MWADSSTSDAVPSHFSTLTLDLAASSGLVALIVAVANWPASDNIKLTLPSLYSHLTKIQCQHSSPVTISPEAQVPGWLIGQDRTEIERSIHEMVSQKVFDTIGSHVAATAPLMDSGVDSLAAIELQNALQQEFGKSLSVSSVLVFDYPTVQEMSNFLTGQLVSTELPHTQQVSPNLQSTEPYSRNLRFPFAAFDSTLPGGCGTFGSFFRSLVSSYDSTCSIPTVRFENKWSAYGIDHFIETCQGHFISDVESFDNQYFGISRLEVASTDPSHRLLLEKVHNTMTLAGHNKQSAMNSNVMVSLGFCNVTDWPLVRCDASMSSNVYSQHGMDGAAAAGRISYLFGLKGPCFTVNTACSSSLVAIDAAYSNLQLGKSTSALVAGVALQLHASSWPGLVAMHALAPDGCCKTFDASADGFGRSEACGVALLQQPSSTKDQALSLLGTALNQDGRSASFMAPNGPSQVSVIQTALHEAYEGNIQVHQPHVETHGTGTALGDPIEVGALRKACAPGKKTVVLGAAKSHVAHTEGASGIVGVLKAALALQHKSVLPNMHLVSMNDKLKEDVKQATFLAPSQMAAFQSDMSLKQLVSGVSSFGYTGTNAHAIIPAVAEFYGTVVCNESLCLVLKRCSFAWYDKTQHEKCLLLGRERNWFRGEVQQKDSNPVHNTTTSSDQTWFKGEPTPIPGMGPEANTALTKNPIGTIKVDPNESVIWENHWDPSMCTCIAQHKAGQTPIAPSSTFLHLAAVACRNQTAELTACRLADVECTAMLFMNKPSGPLCVVLDHPAGIISIESIRSNHEVVKHATMSIQENSVSAVEHSWEMQYGDADLSGDVFYGLIGNDYQGSFRSVASVWLTQAGSCVSHIRPQSSKNSDLTKEQVCMQNVLDLAKCASSCHHANVLHHVSIVHNVQLRLICGSVEAFRCNGLDR